MNVLLRISLLRLALGLYAVVLRISTGINRTSVIVRREILHILRNRGTFFLTTVSPVMMTLVLMYSFTVDVRDVPISVLDNNHSVLSHGNWGRWSRSW